MPTSTLIFDGDCGFCTTSAGWAQRIDPTAQVVPYQRIDLAVYRLTEAEARLSVRWSDGDGHVAAGAAAIAAYLRAAGQPWRALGIVLDLPVVRVVAAVVYRWVAGNRHRLPGGTPACALQAPEGVDDAASGSV